MKCSNREIACYFLYLIQTATEISGIHVVYTNCLHWAQPDLKFPYHLLINFRVYVAFFTDFFPYVLYQALLSAEEKIKHICYMARLYIIGMSYVNCVFKNYSSALSHYLTSCLAEPGICSQPTLWKSKSY